MLRQPSLGSQLHANITADRWCVTKGDLHYLRSEVKLAIRNLTITPTDRDCFDRFDNRIGPTIYTVCEQYIKPVTRDADDVSWALMRNPRGLDCDIFVTHAWQEGIFEFIDKVLDSWPRGADWPNGGGRQYGRWHGRTEDGRRRRRDGRGDGRMGRTDGQRTTTARTGHDGMDGQSTDDDDGMDDGTDGRTEDDGGDGTDTTGRTDRRYV